MSAENPGDPRVSKAMLDGVSVFRDPGDKNFRETIVPSNVERGSDRGHTPEERRRMTDFGADLVRRAMDG